MYHDHAAAVGQSRERGAALVECALVLPVILLMTLGMVEVARMARSQMVLAQAAREGAQSGARGLTVERIVARATNTAAQSGLVRSRVSVIEVAKSSSGTSWQALGNDSRGQGNDANRGNMVRVVVRYQHPYVSNAVFGGGTVNLTSSIVARRN